ncbi:MAG TPA: hypothetical protein VGH28_01990 [Polyangiaceae bacterium]|jgi:hypothetical protein
MRLLAAFVLLPLAACVGDETAPQDAGIEAAAEAGIDAAPDAPADSQLVCGAGTADCDPNVAGCETSLLSSDTNCGACGHDCGGAGLCAQGVCQPLAIAKSVGAPASLAVGGTSVFWMIASSVQRCAVTGCNGTPGDEGEAVNVPQYPTGNMIVADSANVYWVGYTTDASSNSIFICPDSGCTGLQPTPFYGNGRSVELVANTANLYWLDTFDGGLTRVKKSDKSTASLNINVPSGPVDLAHIAADDAHVLVTYGDIAINGGGLYVCDAPSDCAAGLTRLLDTAFFVADNGVLAVANQPQTGTVVACDLGGCSGSGTTLATGEKGITAMIADAQNVYWTIKGTGTAADGTIRACSLPSCTGGPRTLASGQAAPAALAQDANFVYWANAGTGAANTGSIMRVRK